MNSDVLLIHMKKLTENINELGRKINERDKLRSDSWYEDNLDHDYGYESNYCHPYDTHQFPHPRNKEFLTISSEAMSKYQTQPKPRVSDSGNPIRYPTQVIIAVKKQDKQSHFDFSEILGAPHPMPNNYTRRLPQFSGNNDISIEIHLDILWDYMEIIGADNEYVYMRALEESLRGDVQL